MSEWWTSPGGEAEYEREREELLEAMRNEDYGRAEEIVGELRAHFGDEGSRMGEVFKDIYNETQPTKDVVEHVLRPAFGSPRVA